MSGLRIEAFLSTPVCANSAELIQLLKEIEIELGESVEVVTYERPNEMSEEYHVTSTPAVVVEGLVKMMGFCPSKESLLSALKEVGLE
jgi:hypothetical protein